MLQIGNYEQFITDGGIRLTVPNYRTEALLAYLSNKNDRLYDVEAEVPNLAITDL